MTDTTETQSSTEATTETTEVSATETGSETQVAASANEGSSDDGTLVGSSSTESGTGDEGSKEGSGPTPTPVPDDEGVPEAYELKLTSTNEAGEEVAQDLDPVLVEEATPIFKDLKLTNDQANKLTALMPKIHDRFRQQQNDDFAVIRADWKKQAVEDPDIGGKNLDESRRLAAKALDHFGARSEIKEIDGRKVETNEFRRILNETGIGEHPAVLRMFRDIGSALSEDNNFIRNTSEVKQDLSREQKNYPNDVPKT